MISASNGRWLGRLGGALLAGAVGLSAAADAMAGVTRQGEWPEDPSVSLDLDGVPRNEALKRLADEAGWSLVLHAPSSDPVDVRVADQPAGKVLEVLLSDGEYVASRDGALITVSPQRRGAAPPAPPEPPAGPRPPVPPDPPGAAGPEHGGGAVDPERAPDRAVSGASLRIERGEVVNDVSVFGGSLDVLGTVTGDIHVVGGAMKVHEGAHVRGDVEVLGGSVMLDDNARIDGDVDVVGGAVERAERAVIGGDVSTDVNGEPEGLASRVGGAITRTALLFVFGAVLIALASHRVERLKVDIASRPMKSFALGIVGGLGAIALFAALCVTVIGIPFAVIGALLAVVAVFAGACAVLETAGAAALGHRTKNPYVHLAGGCLAYLLLGAIPYIGAALQVAVFLIGMGALVSTRLAGFIKPRNGVGVSPDAHPFRTAA